MAPRHADTFLLALLAIGACAPAPPAGPGTLLPHPVAWSASDGTFVMSRSTRVVVPPGASELARVAGIWAASVADVIGPLPGVEGPCGRGDVCLRVDGAAPPEGYLLTVAPDSVTVVGSDPAGVFYGLQTLAQMLPATAGTRQRIEIAAAVVRDAPRFSWRGMHLDVGRHFFGPEFVKRYIDQLARYKLNRFHWHLTEDQGWRIEIERYPRLTSVGAWRRETMVEKNFAPYVGDGVRYGGFYTRDEIRDIVSYAAERYVTIVPEIEMPGHSLAALAAYPELACTEGPFEPATTWGVFDDILCPKEETFTFLEGVLTEVMELFPGPWIHVGGDEAPKVRWASSPVAQDVIRREGLADEAELQSWFIGRIGRFLEGHGRRLVGWDEILEGGLPPGATVMSWRGTEGGIEAARRGHDVVMTPTSHLYFDYYQGDPAEEPLANGGFLPLEQVYAFEPVPDALDDGDAGRILGAQGNVWTEYLRTEDRVEYMVFPRLFALVERVWSPAGTRDFGAFAERLPWHLERLDALGIAYRIPEVPGLERDRLTLDGRAIVALTPAAHGTVRYTVDGSEPGPASPAYDVPLEVDVSAGPVTVSARHFTPDGAPGPVRAATFRRTELRPAALVDAPLEPGFTLDLFLGSYRRTADLEARGQTVARREGAAAVAIPESAPVEGFGLRFRGYLDVPEDAVYSFRLTSDDGAVLRFGGTTALDHDGLHGPTAREGQVALARGLHPMELLYFQAGGGRTLTLDWAGPDGVFTPLDAAVVSRVRPSAPPSAPGGV